MVDIIGVQSIKGQMGVRYVPEIIFPSYNGYEKYVTPEFRGENYEDLMFNIKQYCKEIVELINEPVKDCPHCKGRGVLIKESI